MCLSQQVLSVIESGALTMLFSTQWTSSQPHNINLDCHFYNFFLSRRLTTPSFNTLWIQQANLLNILDKIRQHRTLPLGLQNTCFHTNSNNAIKSNQMFKYLNTTKSAGLARDDQKKSNKYRMMKRFLDDIL